MRDLYERWINELHDDVELVEAPPSEIEGMATVARGMSMEHPLHGAIEDVPSELLGKLREQGGQIRLGPTDFLELLHVQAWYFQARWFPRLHWSLLWAPPGSAFVLGDRPVVWQADGHINVPPAALRHPSAHVLAPLTSGVALLGCTSERSLSGGISSEYVNLLSTASARRWIFGPGTSVVEASLETLRIVSSEGEAGQQ